MGTLVSGALQPASVGLCRDLAGPFIPLQAKNSIVVRPQAPSDDLAFLESAPCLSPDEAFGRLTQRRLLRTGLRTCYVAGSASGKGIMGAARCCLRAGFAPYLKRERFRLFHRRVTFEPTDPAAPAPL